MDFYLTAPSGARLHFPVNPERVTAQTGARMQTFDILELGELRLPRGKEPARISWDGLFPGAARAALPFVRSWRPPQELVAELQAFRDRGERVGLLVTETPLNLDVYVETFEHAWGGAYGDCNYRLQLVQARDLAVYTDAEWHARKAAQPQADRASRPAPPPPKSYIVRSGDTLWAIAKRTLGDGSCWRELHEANRGVIGPDANLIRPGQVLRIPGGGGSAVS